MEGQGWRFDHALINSPLNRKEKTDPDEENSVDSDDRLHYALPIIQEAAPWITTKLLAIPGSCNVCVCDGDRWQMDHEVRVIWVSE